MTDINKFEPGAFATGVSGDGAVRVGMNRDGTVLGVEIAEFILNPKDKEMTEGLIAAAVENALLQLRRSSD